MIDVIAGAGTTAAHTFATAALPPERIRRDRLDVSRLREDDNHFFIVDEVEHVDLTDIGRKSSTALVSVARLELTELVLDDGTQLGFALEDRFQLLDRRAELLQLIMQLLAIELGKATQRHVEDVVRLHLGELEGFRHELGASIIRVG